MIQSVSNSRVKEWMKLKQSKGRKQTGLFLVEGEHLVEEAYKQGIVECIIYLDEYKRKFDCEMVEVSRAVLDKLAFVQSPQSVMAVCHIKENTFDYYANKYLILDNVQDPGNIGTLLRTALALGYKHIVLSANSCDLYNDKLIRSTQGALFYLNIIQGDVLEEIKKLQYQGVHIVGTSLHEARVIQEASMQSKIGIVLGNEGNGVSKAVLDACDERVFIPIEEAESLNVGIAGGICMFYFNQK